MMGDLLIALLRSVLGFSGYMVLEKKEAQAQSDW